MYCPNCGARVFDKECELCGPSEIYAKAIFCVHCGKLKEHKITTEIHKCEKETKSKEEEEK